MLAHFASVLERELDVRICCSELNTQCTFTLENFSPDGDTHSIYGCKITNRGEGPPGRREPRAGEEGEDEAAAGGEPEADG